MSCEHGTFALLRHRDCPTNSYPPGSTEASCFTVPIQGLVPCKECDSRVPIPTPAQRAKADRIDFLERRRKAVIADMMIKAEGEDWHGVQDCASDLRDTDNELDGLRF